MVRTGRPVRATSSWAWHLHCVAWEGALGEPFLRHGLHCSEFEGVMGIPLSKIYVVLTTIGDEIPVGLDDLLACTGLQSRAQLLALPLRQMLLALVIEPGSHVSLTVV